MIAGALHFKGGFQALPVKAMQIYMDTHIGLCTQQAYVCLAADQKNSLVIA